MNKVTVLLAAFCLTGCGILTMQKENKKYAKAEFAVLSAVASSESPESFCADFDLTIDQAKDFFIRGKEISIAVMHDDYDWLACYVDGSLMNESLSAHSCIYTVQAGGTAMIQCTADQTYIWACDNCEDLLRASAE